MFVLIKMLKSVYESLIKYSGRLKRICLQDTRFTSSYEIAPMSLTSLQERENAWFNVEAKNDNAVEVTNFSKPSL